MKFHLLKAGLLFIFLFSGARIFAQQNAPYRTIYSLDSVAGFDERNHQAIALSLNLYGDEYLAYMFQQKRVYINEKYNLEFPVIEEAIMPSGRYGTGATYNAPCVNEDFEQNTFNGWTVSQGTNGAVYNGTLMTACITNPCPTALSTGSLASIVSTPFNDAFIGQMIPNSPLGGSKVARLNTQTISNPFTFPVVKIAQNFPVTANNSLFEFAYYAVMDATSSHNCCDQPYMYVKVRDNFGNIQTGCPIFSITVPGSGCSGTGATNWVTSGGKSRSNGWQKYSIDLATWVGVNISVEVTVGHCQYGGHYGYSYFDATCNSFNLTVNNTNTVVAPTAAPVTATAPCATTATLSAPGGMAPYLWNGPGITGVTTQSIVANTAGNYSISMNPLGVCNTVNRVLSLNFPPPTTITVLPTSSICTSGSVTSATLTAAGATSYTWAPPGFASPFTVVTPTINSTYTLTGQTGTCVGTWTREITVNPTPTVNILTSNTSLCPGQVATLTAFGGDTYTWLPVGGSGPSITVSQTAATTYSAIGTSTAGCTATGSTNITMAIAPSVNLFYVGAPVICAGSPATLIGIGASNFTWNPGGSTANPIVVTPFVTTTFTGIGASGTCTNSAVYTVSVDPGPTLTVLSSPTLICPYESATLTAFGASALSYTWLPSTISSSTVVLPVVQTTYSVNAVNALGCISQYTVAPIIAPVPVLTITPITPTVCFNSTISLTASGGSTYSWNPGNLTGSAVAVSPTASTVYSIVGSNGTCTSSINSSVTVVPLPTVSINSATTSICFGQSVALDALGASNYTWLPISSNATNVVVSPTVTTTYTLVGNTAGCDNFAYVTVTVNSLPILSATANPTAICPGFNATLSANGATSYTWDPGAVVSESTIVSPSASIVYTLTGASVFGCLNTATVGLVVNPVPTINVSAGSPSICAGFSTSLSATGAVTYTWEPGAIAGASISASPSATAVYTVSGSNALGCITSDTINLIVVPNPTVTAAVNPTAICVGFNATLTSNGANNYTWMPGSMTGSSAIVSPTATTVYTVSGNTAGCSNSTTVQLIINYGPTITAAPSPTAICPGFNSTLSANGAVSYTWNPGATISSSVVVSPVATSVYSVTGETAFGCLTTNTISLVVNPVPTINVSAGSPSICAGFSTALSATGAVTYTWLPGPVNGASISASPSVTTVYTVSGSNALGCITSNTINLIVVPNPTVTAAVNPTAVCVGFNATLTVNGANNYTWMPGPITGSSAIVSPTATTVYTVTGNSLGCSNSTTVELIINNGPTITAAPSPTAICPGFTSTLGASGAVSYTWNPGLLNGASVTVSPASTTVYSVTGETTFGCLTTNTISLVVNPVPTINVSAGSPSICAGFSTALSATGAVTYTWLPGPVNGASISASPSVTTIYTVSGANALGCITSNTINLIVVPNPTVTAAVNPTAVCVGFNATLTANGANNYTWMPGPITGSSAIVSPTATTVYTLTGNTAGCSNSTTVQLIINYGPTITAAPSPTAICPGFTSTLGAIGAVSYTWNPGLLNGASVTVSPASTTIYSVTGESTFGCLTTNTISLVVNPVPTINVSAGSPSICAGFSTALSATGAVTYTWLPGPVNGASISASPSVTTVYTVSGSNALGCITSNTINLIIVPNPTVTAAVNPTAVCVGFNATLTANGANNYTWMPGSMTGSSAIVSPTATTVYTVTGNTAGCSNSTTVQLIINNGPTLTAAPSPTAICPGFNSTLSASGAVSYTWNPGGTISSSVVVSPPTGVNVYSVTGASAFGCLTTNTISLLVNPTPTINPIASSPSICAGTNASLSATGAATYTWNPGPTSGSMVVVSPSATTNYTVVGTSTAGCLGQNTINLIIVPNPTVTTAVNPTAVCVGFNVTLTANGANNYTWMPGSMTGSSAIVSPTATTVYTVSGNTAGCSNSTTVQLIINNGPTLTAAPSPTAICPGFNSTLSANGAVSYTWNPGGTISSSVVVSPPTGVNVYSVTGANAFGCLTTNTISLLVNPTPTINPIASSPSICAGTNASLSATGAATYTWNPGPASGSMVVVSPSATTNYTVVGTSTAGCLGQNTINLIIVPNPTVTAAVTPTAVCVGFNATLTANGANNYTWMPGSMTGSSAIVSPTATTVYTVSGNTAGCSNSTTVQLIINNGPTLTAAPSPTAICPGFNSTLSASGAVSYTWNPGGTINSSVVVSPPTGVNIYSVTGASAFGCLTTNTISLLVNPTPTISPVVSSPSICAGSSASLSATGAASYTWNPGPASGSMVVVSPTATTNYTVVGTSSAGCLGQNTINLIIVPNPTVTAAVNPTAVCVGFNATLTANGANNYTWMPGPITGSSAIVSPTATTVYTVTGNTAGCSNSTTVQLIINNGPTLTAAPSPTAICPGFNSTLSASGAVSYTWNPGGTISSSVVVNPPTGVNVYSVTGASVFGCLTTNTISLLVNPTPTINPVVSSPSICAGSSASLSATGAASYTWNPGPASGSVVVVSPSATTNYTVVGTSSAGCLGQNTINLIIVPNPTVTAAVNPTAVCVGFNATLTANGANNYTWMPGPITGSSAIVSPIASTVYTVTGNTAGCAVTATVSLLVNPSPTPGISASANPICSGNISTLTANAAASYTWSPGGVVAVSHTVNPNTTSIYTVAATSTAGCIGQSQFTLTVNPTPTVIPSMISATICAGSSQTISYSGATSYVTNPGVLTTTIVNLSPATTTNYTITGTTGACSSNTTLLITVNPVPTIVATASPTNLCTGNSASLSASGAVTYTWLPLNISGSLIPVNPMTTTLYTVTGTNSLNCIASNTLNLLVSPTPSMTASLSSTVICASSPATLSAVGALSYTWQPGNITGSTTVVNPTTTTTYTLYGDNGSICSQSITITLSVNPLPSPTIATTSTALCLGNSATLTALGGQTYTWTGLGNTSTINVSPVITTNYTLTTTDLNGCINSTVLILPVNNNPTVTAQASPTVICDGGTSTLSALGANTYSWLPVNLSGTSIAVSPTLSANYTVTGTDLNGCVNTITVDLTVLPNPTYTLSAANTSICVGESNTLTATGATNYTWMPGASNGNTLVINPIITTIYTVLATNTTVCSTTQTITAFVNQLPANLSASASTLITCATPSVNLSAASTDTDVVYSWNGPSSFTSNSQNPLGVGLWGDFTVTVTNTITGCVATVTTAVLTDYSIPSLTLTANYTLTCAVPVITLTTAHTTTNPAFLWTGPSGFSSTIVSPTITTGGTYSILVTDQSSGCSSSATVAVSVHTSVAASSSLSLPTCSAGISNNDGTIYILNFISTDRFAIVSGASFTAAITYTNATPIPTSGIATNTLANPSTTVAYTLRIFDLEGCFRDSTFIIVPADCEFYTLGLANAVSVPQPNADGSYNVTYTIAAKNYDTTPLTNIILTDNLAATFVAPTQFTVIAPPETISGSGINLNSAFDGKTQQTLTAAGSSLAVGETQTFSFTLKVYTPLFYQVFNNTVLGIAKNGENATVKDSSNVGTDTSPLKNVMTPITFTPTLRFGITKTASFVQVDSKSFDVTYSIKVHNLSNDTLKNVVLRDSLSGFILQPATYSIKSAPIANGGLVANPAFGETDFDLINVASSILDPGAVGEVVFTIHLNPDSVTVIRNSAYGRAEHRSFAQPSVITSVFDISNDGDNPDTDNNLVCNELSDNVPTTIKLPFTYSLFIPEGFSPDGDGINDQFVIKGLPSEGKNSLTIYNRWGNRVYYHENYNDAIPWDGMPNVAGTFGQGKLPQGTYYYVLEMQNGEKKAVTGYIILQY